MTHDEQKRVAQMVGQAVKDALECFADLDRAPDYVDIGRLAVIAENYAMEQLSLQRIAREAGEYATGSGMVN